jgi:hypothetical protein
VTLEADTRRQSSEEQAAWRQHAPHFFEHRGELALASCEVQNGTADDRVRRAVLPRKGIERTAMNLVRRQRRVQGCDELAHRANRRGVRVHGPHLEAVSQEERKITSRAAAGVQHAPATVESSTKELVEQVDVDLAELGS